MKKECLFGHSFALLEQWEAVIFSLFLYIYKHWRSAFQIPRSYGKGSDLLCAAGGVVLGIEMWLFLSKERNRV